MLKEDFENKLTNIIKNISEEDLKKETSGVGDLLEEYFNTNKEDLSIPISIFESKIDQIINYSYFYDFAIILASKTIMQNKEIRDILAFKVNDIIKQLIYSNKADIILLRMFSSIGLKKVINNLDYRLLLIDNNKQKYMHFIVNYLKDDFSVYENFIKIVNMLFQDYLGTFTLEDIIKIIYTGDEDLKYWLSKYQLEIEKYKNNYASLGKERLLLTRKCQTINK